VVAAARAPAAVDRLERLERRLRERVDLLRGDGLTQRLRDRVSRAVADLEQPLASRAAAAGEPVAAVLARELDAELLEPVAWMPPCAFAELQDWSVPFAATATRAPARCAETAAESPEAPLPMTRTS